MLNRYCFALDLKDDDALITEYEALHKNIPPQVAASIEASGIVAMEIYRVGNRLFMLMEADESFSPEAKAAADAANENVLEWERRMWNYQQPLPFAAPGEKWLPMKQIFTLTKRDSNEA